MARRAGIFVIEFALGMGPKLLTFRGKKKSEHPIEGEENVTLYTLRLLPIGGFCAVRGQDEDMPDDPEAMTGKPIASRALFMAGGSFFNFALALILFFAIVFLTGYTVPQVHNLQQGSPARRGGLIEGDRITHLNGNRVRLWESFRWELDANGGQPMDVRAVRDGQRVDLVITPERGTDGVYRIGFSAVRHIGVIHEMPDVPGIYRVTVGGSLLTAADMIGFHIRMPFRMLAQAVTRRSVPEGGGVMGPIGIATIVTDVYQETIDYGLINMMIPMIFLTALISVALGIMNLLPIPALDGSRLVFLFIEAIRRKPISREREGMVHLVGFVVLIALAIFIAYRDIANIINL